MASSAAAIHASYSSIYKYTLDNKALAATFPTRNVEEGTIPSKQTAARLRSVTIWEYTASTELRLKYLSSIYSVIFNGTPASRDAVALQ